MSKADVCDKCLALLREELHGAEYEPMCWPCAATARQLMESGTVIFNDGRHSCSVCRRACGSMRLAEGHPVCWECHGWWKRCAKFDEYVVSSNKLFQRLDNMGMGHTMSALARRLLNREEHYRRQAM